MSRDDRPPLTVVDGEPPARRFQLIKAASVEPKAPKWLIRGHLESDSLALVFGDPGCGKSFLAVDMACSVATARDFHGHKVTHGPVVYLAGEGLNGLARRRLAWCIRNQESLEDVPLYVSTGPAALCDPGSALEVQRAVDEVAEAEGSPALVVVDTLARNFGPGDENSTQDMGIAVQVMDAIRTAHRAAVVLVHHTGHGDKSRARGAMALKGALDAEYRMEKDDEGVVRFEATKMKDAEPPAPSAFRLCTVELGFQDDAGDEVTSAVLDPVDWTPPATKQRRSNATRGGRQQQAMGILRGLCDDGRLVTPGEWKQALLDEQIPKRSAEYAMQSLKQHGEVLENHGCVRPAA